MDDADFLAFVRLVAEMRETQKEFFDTRRRRPDTLARARALERRVDRALEDHLPGQQKTFFGGEEEQP